MNKQNLFLPKAKIASKCNHNNENSKNKRKGNTKHIRVGVGWFRCSIDDTTAECIHITI